MLKFCGTQNPKVFNLTLKSCYKLNIKNAVQGSLGHWKMKSVAQKTCM